MPRLVHALMLGRSEALAEQLVDNLAKTKEEGTAGYGIPDMDISQRMKSLGFQ